MKKKISTNLANKMNNQTLYPIAERANCFVIQPFGLTTHPRTGREINNDKVYEALKNLERIRPTFPIRVYRADVKTYQSEDLHTHVLNCIRSSDFCVADFTGQNVNVFYESGLARGLGRSVIIICQDRNDIPTDMKGFIAVSYRMEDLSYLANDIDQHLDRIQEEVVQLRQLLWTRVQYFSQRDDAQIRERIRNATQKIDILQTNLAIIQGSYIPDIIGTMRSKNELKLRILTLDPQSIFVNYRGQQLGFKENIALYRGELESNLRAVHFQLREFGNRVQIKVYDDFPTQIVFFFDDQILACVVSATGRSRENCAFLLDAHMPGAQKSFIEHFDYLWNEKSVFYPQHS